MNKLLTLTIASELFLLLPFLIIGGGPLLYLAIDDLYSNHIEQARQQLERKPFPLPQLNIRHRPNTIFDYSYGDFEILNYQSHPSIKAPIAV